MIQIKRFTILLSAIIIAAIFVGADLAFDTSDLTPFFIAIWAVALLAYEAGLMGRGLHTQAKIIPVEATAADKSHLQLQKKELFSELLRDGGRHHDSLASAFRPLTKALAENLNVDRAGLWLFDEVGGLKYAEFYSAATGQHQPPEPCLLADDRAKKSLMSMSVDGVTAINNCARNPLTRDIYNDVMRPIGLQSTLRAPVFFKGELAGFITCGTCHRSIHWAPEQKTFAIGIANVVALIIERHQRQAAERRLLDGQQTLARQQALLSSLLAEKDLRASSLDNALDELLRVLAQETKADRVGMAITDEIGPGSKYRKAYVTKYDEFVEASEAHLPGSFPIFDGLSPGHIVAIDATRSSQDVPPSIRRLIDLHDIRSLMRIPVTVGGSVAGLIYVAMCGRHTSWAPETKLFAMSIGNLAALAVERHQRLAAEARLADGAAQLARHQEAMNGLLRSDEMRRGNLTTTLQALARVLGQEFKVDRTAISALDATGSEVTFAETYLFPDDRFTPAFIEDEGGVAGYIKRMPKGTALRTLNPSANRDAQSPASIHKLGIQSLLQIPIEVGDRIIGVINASSTTDQIEWSNEQKLFGMAIANLAALAIEREQRERMEVRLAEGARVLSRQQDALNELMRSEVVRNGTLEEALRELARVFAVEASIDRIAITVADPARDHVIYTEAYDARENAFKSSFGAQALDPRKMLRIVERGRMIVIDDFATSALEYPQLMQFYGALLAKLGARSFLQAPIEVDGVVVGIINASICGRAVPWTSEQKLFATAISGLAALVIERENRVRMEAAVRESARRIESQHSAINALMSSDALRIGSLRDALRALSRAFSKEANLDQVHIRLVTTAKNESAYSEVYKAVDDHFTDVLAVDSVSSPNIDDELSDALQIPTNLCVAIRLHDTVTGYITGSVPQLDQDWSPEQRLMATAISQLAALAVERHQRLRIERSLRHANRIAEEASRAKSLFLANMSHEIRTPMNGVFGMTDLLLQTNLTERQHRLVGTMNQSAKSLLTIINDILDLSRIESGKFDLDHHPFDLRNTIEEVVELFAEEAQRKGLELTFFMAANVPERVNGDPIRLRQIFVNLVGNALKFTKSGDVAVRVVVERITAGKATIAFEIRDTGIGIDAATQARLFKPFSQADSSISRRFGGTGLGLSISRYLIELMGGAVKLESTIDVGTTLSFTIPLEKAEAVGYAIDADSLVGRRFLVVDEHATNREIVATYLRSFGATTENAHGRDAAHEMMIAAHEAGKPFAAVIVDLTKSDSRGLDWADRVRGDARTASCPLIIVAPMSWKSSVRTGYEARYIHMLSKPVRRNELLNAVTQALSGTAGPISLSNDANTPAAPKIFRARVLVAEDNPVNEEVVREYLHNLGCKVTIARNGLEAIAAFKAGRFDLVLMDCQMPELDGLSATERIRIEEVRQDGAGIPIIAVTANAYAEDREACLRAGMNDYLSKPFSEKQLIDVLENWARHTMAGENAAKDDAVTAETTNQLSIMTKPDVDFTALESMRVGRPKLFARMLQAYMTHSPQVVAELMEAVTVGNVSALSTAAHSLKSSSANVGARRMAKLSRDLEAMARINSIDEATVVATALASEFESVKTFLQQELDRAAAAA